MNEPMNISALDSTGVEGVELSVPRPLYWSIRRELWENRSILVVPLIMALVALMGSAVSIIGMAQEGGGFERAGMYGRLVRPFRMAPAAIMLTSFVVGAIYCLDALFGERRDRSILFWKSLPVSDRTTVASKAIIPLVVLPLIAFLLSAAVQIIGLVAVTPFLLAKGLSPFAFARELAFFGGLPIMIYGLTVHALWFAPIYAWFLLVSAWARRAAFLWALLPMLAISAAERIAFSSMGFMSMLQYRMTGAMVEAFSMGAADHGDVERLTQLTPFRFLTAPGLWAGLAFAVVCLAACVWLRRNREPI